MANTNWFIGIDEGSSTPGGTQVALSGYIFVDHTFVGVSDGSPDAPYTSIQSAITNASANDTIVISDGTYIITSNGTVTTTGLNFIANINHQVSIISDNPATFRILVDNDSLSYRFTGIKFQSVIPPRLNIDLRNCVFDLSSTGLEVSAGGYTKDVNIDNCVFIDTDLRIAGRAGFEVENGHSINNCTFVGENKIKIQAVYVNNYTLNITNCDFEIGYDLEHNNSLNIGSSNFSNSNFRGTITNVDAGSVLPQAGSNINIDPEWSGDPNNLEFIIDSTSGLIGAGSNNSTIGAFRVGQLIDLSSPAENNDITVGPPITITNPATTGNIKPAIITFSQIRKSPIIKINGFFDDNTNDIPDDENTSAINPKRQSLPILWRETVGGGDNTEEFLYNCPNFSDDQTDYTGQNDYNPFDISSTGDIVNNLDRLTSTDLITVEQIQPNLTLNDQ